MFMYYVDTLREPLEQSLEYVRGLCIGDHWAITWTRASDGNICWYLTEVDNRYPRLLELGDFELDDPCVPGWFIWDMTIPGQSFKAHLPEAMFVNEQDLYCWSRDGQGDVDLKYYWGK